LVLSTQEVLTQVGPDYEDFTPAIAPYLESMPDGGGTVAIELSSIPGHAIAGGTLGEFTIYFRGELTVAADGSWTLTGDASFYDVWDFDPRESVVTSEEDGDVTRRTTPPGGRTLSGEEGVRAAHDYMPGMPFRVYTEEIPFTAWSDGSMTWGHP